MLNKIKRIAEHSPILLGIISYFAFSRYFSRNQIGDIRINRLELILEILIPSMITYIGFIITSITIIIGLNKNHILKIIGKKKRYRFQMFIYFLTPILLSIVIIFVGFCMLLFTDETCNINVFIITIFIGLVIYLVSSTIRLVFILLYIFDDNDYSEKNSIVVDSTSERLNLSDSDVK